MLVFVGIDKYITPVKTKGSIKNIFGIQIITILFWIFYDDEEDFEKGFFWHERLHCFHWFEFFIFLFPVIYFFEGIIKSLFGLGYEEISFEREAYLNQLDPNYADNRKLYSSLKYIFPLNRKMVDLTPFRRKARKTVNGKLV